MGYRHLILLLALSCSPTPVPQPAETPASCSAACARWREMGCEEGQPTAEGKTCEDVCLHVGEAGIGLDTACVQQASSCEAARSCEAP